MEKEKTDITVTEGNEMSLINGLLKAADYKNNEVRTIEIKRGGETPLFSFDIRPLTADEVEQARHNATTYMPNPNNPKLPQIAKKSSDADFLAWEIYLATVGEMGNKIWDDKDLKAGLINQGHMVATNVDIIKAVLMSGEIEQVCKALDNISGDNTALFDYAKN